MKDSNGKHSNTESKSAPSFQERQALTETNVTAEPDSAPTEPEKQPKKRKWYSRFRLESGELSKIIACGFAIVILYLFFRSTVDLGNLKESLKPELLVIYALKQLLNIIFGYLITLILRIKNEKVQFVLTFVFAFIVDNLLVFEATEFVYTPLNIVLIVFITVILTVFVVRTLFHQRILKKISEIPDEEKRAKRKKAYWIFYWILFALTVAAAVVYGVLVFKTGFNN